MEIPEWFIECMFLAEGELGEKEARERKQSRDVVSDVGSSSLVPPRAPEHKLHDTTGTTLKQEGWPFVATCRLVTGFIPPPGEENITS